MAKGQVRSCYKGRVYAKHGIRSVLRFKNRATYDRYVAATNDDAKIIDRKEFFDLKSSYEAPRWLSSDILPGLSMLVEGNCA